MDEDYSGWSLRNRLEMLAFDARLAGVPLALVTAVWEVIDAQPLTSKTRPTVAVDYAAGRRRADSIAR
jgi:hypothetical protein